MKQNQHSNEAWELAYRVTKAFVKRMLPWQIELEVIPSLSASQAYIKRFRGAASQEVPRIIPRRRFSDGYPVTFGSALMDSLLWSSAEIHNKTAHDFDRNDSTLRSKVQFTERVLEKEGNVATDRSIALHAAMIERLVQTNRSGIFEVVQHNYAVLVRFPHHMYHQRIASSS
jgi:hypothetical protein